MSTAPAITPSPTPNYFELQGHNLHVTYSTSGPDGQPHFVYQDAEQTLQFTGKGIRAESTEIGTLLTVVLRRTIDGGSTSFSLLVPAVNLGASLKEPIKTFAVTTLHRFSVTPFHGQTEISTIHELTGTASWVMF